ncbi:hypothetical protein ACH5RR_023663 [Cinchona calisaya]|uniref:Uncharacterized protein n=1 Tax=Cinchona calisaya TaxID=153742 RepID=A0ABD2ZD64_9GENT
MSALGRPQDMFSDTAIQLQPVFAQWIQNTHALAPGATASTSLTWGGGDLVAVDGKVALLPIPCYVWFPALVNLPMRGSLCPQGRSIGEYQALKRFPFLQSTIAATANEALERFQENSKKTVIRLVDMESSYLNVDFFRRFPQEVEKVGSVAGANAAAATNVDGYAEGHFWRIGSNVSSYINMGKQISELLDEDPTLMERRLQCAKRLELTRKNGMKLILYHGQDDDKGVRCMLETVKQLSELLDEDPALMERSLCKKALNIAFDE